jgi:hypothetical protein
MRAAFARLQRAVDRLRLDVGNQNRGASLREIDTWVWMSRPAQPERGSDWQAVQARAAHRVRAGLSGPLPSSTMQEELSMLHSTSQLSSCVIPCLVHGRK